MINLYEKDSMKLLVGRVDQDVRFTEKDGERMAIVRLVDRLGDKVDIFFKNDMSTPENPKKLADRIENAKVEAGKWLSILVLMETGSPTASGLDFKYQGLWTFSQGKDEQGNEKPKLNIIVGYSASPTRVSEDMFRVSMAEKIYDKETKKEDTRWYSIGFFDDDKDLTAKKAEKLLSLQGEQKSIPCAIRCSSVREKEKDGKVFYNLTGYRIERMMDNETAETAPAEKAA
ncbi:MAG: hypothetical protein LBI03_08935 [Clostridiales bacterium]|jgi:hypothetical protein|nr:hypothetical protein [Clostridiales bacterium]